MGKWKKKGENSQAADAGSSVIKTIPYIDQGKGAA